MHFSLIVLQKIKLMILPLNLILQKTGNIATVTITYNKGISEINYHWNDDEVVNVKGYLNRGVVLNNLSIPSGKSTLYIEVIDENGKKSFDSYDYKYDGIAIDVENVEYSYVKITASDLNGISYMKFRWNNGEETTVYPDEEGDVSIEYESEIPLGENTLYVTAVNKDNLTLQKKGNYKGLKKPEIAEFYIEDDYLYVTVTDENGVYFITQQTNDDAEERFEAHGEKEFSYRYYVGSEKILVKITVTDIDGLSTTIRGKNY